jgi:hypothetical protein
MAGGHLLIAVIIRQVTCLITIPMGYFNLDDNMIVQVIAFVLTVGCWLVWVGASLDSPAFAADGEWVGLDNVTAAASWHIPGAMAFGPFWRPF